MNVTMSLVMQLVAVALILQLGSAFSPLRCRSASSTTRMHLNRNSWNDIMKNYFTVAKKVFGSTVLGTSIMFIPLVSTANAVSENTAIVQQLQEMKVTLAEGSSLQSQIQMLRLQELERQKASLQKQEQELLSQELLYPEGYLIAKATIMIDPLDGKDGILPYGVTKAEDIDPVYSNDESTLFVLAVGREGPPFAARKYTLKDVAFPLVFELTTDDLLFPYTADAWKRSQSSKDSVAMTAIITSSPSLAVPTGTERFGFAISDPTVFAGKVIRSTPVMKVAGKVDKLKYTPSEVELLSGIDKNIADRDALSGKRGL